MRAASSALLRRGWRLRAGAAAGAACAAGALAVAVTPRCDRAAEDVVLLERPEDEWIERRQRSLADSLVDWDAVDLEYAGALATIRRAYALPVEAMGALRTHLLAEARRGLDGAPSSMRMLPAFVTTRVTGEETGEFYALDLGGTNFRVLKLTLLGGGAVGPVVQGKYKLSEATKTGTAEDLFGFLADSVARFVATQGGGDPRGKMGFTFSFPTEQDSLDSGRLIVWNKEFSASGVVGRDVVQLLQEQLRARGIEIEVAALANDTVGTMEAAAYNYPDTAMGVILGTGTNAAYIERTAALKTWAGPLSDEMVINTEWGNLDVGAWMNGYDRAVDGASQAPGAQRFEKMISGMYLGELCRLTLLDPPVLRAFSPACADALRAAFGARMSLPTALMSAVEADDSAELGAAGAALAAAGVPASTLRDRVLLREACVNISTRAAKLSATGIVGLLSQMGQTEGGTVAVRARAPRRACASHSPPPRAHARTHADRRPTTPRVPARPPDRPADRPPRRWMAPSSSATRTSRSGWSLACSCCSARRRRGR
jgi:hexokinase